MTLDLFQNVFEVSDILVPLKGAVRATKLILDARQADDNNTKAWGDLRQRLDDYMAATKKEVDLFEKYSPEERRRDESFIQPLFEHAGYLKHMRDTLAKMMEKPSSSRMNVFQASRISKKDAKLVRQLDLEIEERHRVFTDLLAAYRLQVVARSTEADEKSLLLQLPSVTFVPSSIHTACIQGTRQIVLETISQWADDDEPGKPIFWLCDVAGSGKSSVAMSASESWRTRKMLGGQFFFSMGDSEASNTERFCSTMARELAYHIPELAPHIAKAIKGNPAIMRSSFDEQFRAFVIGPLQYQQKRVVLVIDAIDECKSGSQRKVLLEMLATATRENRNLRIFITGRPDPVTEAVLQSLSIAAKMENRLHDIKYQDNFDDIALYVHQRLDGVLPKEKRQRLIEKANGGFIRAATVCRMLTEDTNMNSPENIYDHLISLEWDGPMEDLRGPFFQRIGSKDTESRIQEQQLEPISISIQEGPLEQLMRLRPPLDLTGEVSLDSTTKLLRSGSYANVYPVEYLGEKVAIKVLKFRRSKNQKNQIAMRNF
ncbi:related to S. pombe trp-asp repeat containing protein [Serendipita indica DSM 11827]|uniref:Related to S. pombe trp-asp repeat containing protein n=1 Tax=Serendipita indica (strain DSM 11827) TaxID=1109443 RepID=G4TX06_SERID|nr:related to S. pombe trp-asp repeat containing protein [Serendipita indica DSM 11827]